MAPGLLIVVGAGPGIGLATARRFGAQGYGMALIARREQSLRNCQNELTAAGVDAVRVMRKVAPISCGPALTGKRKFRC